MDWKDPARLVLQACSLFALVLFGGLQQKWITLGGLSAGGPIVIRVVFWAAAVYLLCFPVRVWVWQRVRPWLARKAAFQVEEGQTSEELGYHISGRMMNQSQDLPPFWVQERPVPVRQAQIEVKIQAGNQGGLACGLNIHDTRGLLYRLCVNTGGEGLLQFRKENGRWRDVQILGSFAVGDWHTLLLRRTREGVQYAIGGTKGEQIGPRWPRRVSICVGLHLCPNTNHSAYVRRPSFK